MSFPEPKRNRRRYHVQRCVSRYIDMKNKTKNISIGMLILWCLFAEVTFFCLLGYSFAKFALLSATFHLCKHTIFLHNRRKKLNKKYTQKLTAATHNSQIECALFALDCDILAIFCTIFFFFRCCFCLLVDLLISLLAF